MTIHDDSDLIDRLRSGIADRQAEFVMPPGVADRARGRARRRSGSAVAAGAVPVLAAAGVAVALATGGSGHPQGASAGGHSPAVGASHAPAGIDTAYVVKRLSAVAGDPSNMILQFSNYPSGEVTSDGSIVGLGTPTSGGYAYLAANATSHESGWSTDAAGTRTDAGFSFTTPVTNGRYTFNNTDIDPATQTYDTQTTSVTAPATTAALLQRLSLVNLNEVRQEVMSSKVVRLGTTTIDGTSAIAFKLPTTGYDDYLYVNAQTYALLELVYTNPAHTRPFADDVEVTQWEPATAASIAAAENSVIPAGYHPGVVTP